MKIKGVNLGNWLVLEKWMSPDLFEGTAAEDEYGLPRQLPRAVYEERIRRHRAEYITERDFVHIKAMGLNAVRIPVPFFVFGDVEPYIGCITELDNAMDWAQQYGLQVLIDLHTVPGGQNGFDNGGICGICTWAQSEEKVEFTLQVLEKLALRYGQRSCLFGIQPVNEPISEEVWYGTDVQGRYKPAIPEKAAQSAPVSKTFLRKFYQRAYERLRAILPEEKAIVFHDGFDLLCWKDFMQDKQQYRNVWLDTHQYLMMAEGDGCEQTKKGYLDYIKTHFATGVAQMSRHFPVICGEWCLSNACVTRPKKDGSQMTDEERKVVYQALAQAQLDAWDQGQGYFYWNYKLISDTAHDPGARWREAWDLCRCADLGWLPRL